MKSASGTNLGQFLVAPIQLSRQGATQNPSVGLPDNTSMRRSTIPETPKAAWFFFSVLSVVFFRVAVLDIVIRDVPRVVQGNQLAVVRWLPLFWADFVFFLRDCVHDDLPARSLHDICHGDKAHASGVRPVLTEG